MSAKIIICFYCRTSVHPLEVFPATAGLKGSSCLPCYIANVDAKRSDADRFAALMGAFGGGVVRK